MKTKIQDMTSGSPGRLIILFAIPLMLGNICQQLYTMVDTMVVGQIAGVEALAALGAVDFLLWVVTGISTGLTQGFSIQLAQYYGAKDFENLRKSLAHSYRLTAFIAVGVFILSQSFAMCSSIRRRRSTLIFLEFLSTKRNPSASALARLSLHIQAPSHHPNV